jgi:transcriptional regulator with XRE-family HTH domain
MGSIEMATLAPGKLKTHGEVIAQEINQDAGFRADWQRLALARQVAAELIRYRAENDLSQRKLAGILGVSQPRIVTLESGENNPGIDTLVSIARATGLEFAIDIAPAQQEPKLVTKSMRESVQAHTHDDVSVRVASSPSKRRRGAAAS